MRNIKISLEDISTLYNNNYTHINGTGDIDDKKVFIDIKGLFNRNEAEKMDYLYWRL